jgi:hypothetical protein
MCVNVINTCTLVMPRVIKCINNIYKITYIEMQILHAHSRPLLLKQFLLSVSLHLPFFPVDYLNHK